ncbi:hypothetical protein ACH5RR_004736 [Cinchona calisaya]|uniref:Senescence regulator n=1 Tax=Cinchona calisaya TaxID=153742 RepID=A0ABD3AYE0_9GENT
MASAARKSFLDYLGGGTTTERVINPEAQLDFDESDVWNSNTDTAAVPFSDKAKKSTINNNFTRPLKKPIRKSTNIASAAATSLPVNVPDWSRILGDEYRRSNRGASNEDDEEEEEEEEYYGRLPPHEYLAKTRGSSFSVHEGIGRTLKGRDLRRVRNAVWKQIGFED